MGCGVSKAEEPEAIAKIVSKRGSLAEAAKEDTKEVEEAKVRHRQIEQQIQADRLKELTVIKVLLLGGPSSGKTTIFKQMRILHLNGFTESDYVNYRYIIHSNAVMGLQQMLSAAATLGLALSASQAEDAEAFGAFLARESVGNHEVDAEMGILMSRLWSSPSLQAAFANRFSFNFLEGTKHFLDDIERLAASDYRPSTIDILLARFRTTGIYEMSFQFNDLTLRMVDVGGQKSEQKKWIHCFDNVQMLLFVASLADYDLFLEEEPSTNRMIHSIDIFRNLCVSPYFKDTAFILFLNKRDVFAEKIFVCRLSSCFESYQGTGSFEAASAYILSQFVDCFPLQDGKRLYGHFTTATDTTNVQKVFDDCMHQILRQNMSNAGVA